MNTLDRLEKLEGQSGNISEHETIIPKFQNPDTCVFCTDKDYDHIFYLVFRVDYNLKKGKDFEKQDKETCIHHTDDWLKHSLRSAGFAWSAIMEDKESMMGDEIIKILENKEEREKLLTKKYDEGKNYSTAIDLYLPKSSNTDTKGRYNNAYGIEDDIPVQNKIIQNKLKIYYNKAIEVLHNFDDEKGIENVKQKQKLQAWRR